jgi:hypothetical protein
VKWFPSPNLRRSLGGHGRQWACWSANGFAEIFAQVAFFDSIVKKSGS